LSEIFPQTKFVNSLKKNSSKFHFKFNQNQSSDSLKVFIQINRQKPSKSLVKNALLSTNPKAASTFMVYLECNVDFSPEKQSQVRTQMLQALKRKKLFATEQGSRCKLPQS
jgi:hypothetical protein